MIIKTTLNLAIYFALNRASNSTSNSPFERIILKQSRRRMYGNGEKGYAKPVYMHHPHGIYLRFTSVVATLKAQ